ncbi:MAG TPA: CBS domain-containing protein [Polyangiaceae bacterium]|nr:CBS domain-containing protein [Polyangiaceae bacterium]
MSLARYCEGKRVIVRNSHTSAFEGVRALADNHVGALIVQEEGRLVGIVTDRDLALRVIGFELNPKTTRLRDVMSPEPVTLSPEDSEEQAFKLMRARHVRRIPIVDEGKVVGMVTLDDLLMSGAIDASTAAQIVDEQLSEPSLAKAAGQVYPTLASALHAVTSPGENERSDE